MIFFTTFVRADVGQLAGAAEWPSSRQAAACIKGYSVNPATTHQTHIILLEITSWHVPNQIKKYIPWDIIWHWDPHTCSIGDSRHNNTCSWVEHIRAATRCTFMIQLHFAIVVVWRHKSMKSMFVRNMVCSITDNLTDLKKDNSKSVQTYIHMYPRSNI